MFGIDDALITGGATLLGGLSNNIFGMGQQQQSWAQSNQNQWQSAMFNLAAQQQNQAWQTQMANTQYQRGVTDMRAAGLNPALMFGSGGPAPTPQSAPVQMQAQNAPVYQPRDFITPAVSSALQAYQLSAAVRKMDAEVRTEEARARDLEAHVPINTETAKTILPLAKARAERDSFSAAYEKELAEGQALKNEHRAKYGMDDARPFTPAGALIMDAYQGVGALRDALGPGMPGSWDYKGLHRLSPESHYDRFGGLYGVN